MLIELLCWLILGLFIVLMEDVAKHMETKDDIDKLLEEWEEKQKRFGRSKRRWWEVWK